MKYLIEISRLVVKFSACNLMVTYNVAVSFGPVIFRTRHLFREDVMKMGIYYDVMMRMINDFEDIFVTERPTFDLKSFQTVSQLNEVKPAQAMADEEKDIFA